MVDALVSTAVEKLANVLEQELTLFVSAKKELEKLKETFQSIEALLADAESRQVAETGVRLWLSRLRNVAYDIRDVLISNDGSECNDDDDDDVVVWNGNSAVGASCLPSPYACLDHTVSRFKLAHRIKDIRERLNQIDKDKVQFQFRQSGQSSSSGSSSGNRQLVRTRTLTNSHLGEDMIGGVEDKETVICKLVSRSGGGDLHVIAIVGIGGLGRTTLTR